ncbi:MAG: GNAT family N-acetyltransferase [Planctomycetota bacterium]
MADATIDRLAPTDVDTVSHLYNSIFRPEQDKAWIERRLTGRRGVLVQVARIENDAVGFSLGMELKPDTHTTWLCGVVPNMRQAGIATQLFAAADDWARAEGYEYHRFEAENRMKPMLYLGLRSGFEIIGIRFHPHLMTNLVVFEKHLGMPQA